MNRVSNAVADGRLLRGVVAGLGFEAATGLAIYAVWHFLRLIH